MEFRGRVQGGTHLLHARGPKKRAGDTGEVQVSFFHRFLRDFGLQLGSLFGTLCDELATCGHLFGRRFPDASLERLLSAIWTPRGRKGCGRGRPDVANT